MRKIWLLFSTFTIVCSNVFSQSELITFSKNGDLVLTRSGASYFANLSLKCTDNVYPHNYRENLRLDSENDLKKPDELWPSFTGCFDWHSAVHNHWALVKILKTNPSLPEASKVKAQLERSFNAANILKELDYFKSHEYPIESSIYEFEFPYGRSWFLKLVEELTTWDNADARRWVTQLQPLTDYIVNRYLEVWPYIQEPALSGSHNASSLGISFALDYARASHNEALETLMISKAKDFYLYKKNYPLMEEPYDYDFMSAGLLVADLMRKVLSQNDFYLWLKDFAPQLFTANGIEETLVINKVDKHDGFESHWDGFHLNRIWCLNGIMKSLPAEILKPELKKAIQRKQLEMWNYSQASIGKGNYDVDHWLSSFSVFALCGYAK